MAEYKVMEGFLKDDVEVVVDGHRMSITPDSPITQPVAGDFAIQRIKPVDWSNYHPKTVRGRKLWLLGLTRSLQT